MSIKPIDMQTNIGQMHEVARNAQVKTEAIVEQQHVLDNRALAAPTNGGWEWDREARGREGVAELPTKPLPPRTGAVRGVAGRTHTHKWSYLWIAPLNYN
jgi:hypothetical protein